MTMKTVVIFVTVISVLVVDDTGLSASITFCSNVNMRSEMFNVMSTLVRVSGT